MERVENHLRAQLLLRANAQLSQFFASFAEAPVEGTRRELEALRQVEDTLQAVGAVLRTAQDEPQTGIGEQLVCYRRNLLRLRQELARMQQAALISRALVSARLRHLHGAQAWCATAKECD
jgi:hypothetical protein